MSRLCGESSRLLSLAVPGKAVFRPVLARRKPTVICEIMQR